MMVRSIVVRLGLLMALATATASTEVSAQAAAAPSSQASDTEARAREAFQRGRIHYDNGEFDRASKAFEEAYSLSGRHALLYNLYLAYRDANQQEKAAEALRNYLTRVEVIENRPQLEARLKALEEGIAARKAAQAQEQQQAAAAQQAQPAQPQHPSEPSKDVGEPEANKRWWLIPVTTMAAGGALMIGSAATGAMASSKHKTLEDKCPHNTCDSSDSSLKSTQSSGQTMALITDVLLFGGVAVAATGAVLFFLKKPKNREQPRAQRASGSVVCTSRICGGSLSVRF
jgi:tetratricopeptide (TPR) repeat protein